MMRLVLTTFALLLASLLPPTWAAEPPPQSFAATFVQTRTLPGFEQPLTSYGVIRFSQADGFHWQIDKPYHYVFEMHNGRAHEELPDGSQRLLKPEETPWLKLVQRIFVSALSGDQDQLAKYFSVQVHPLEHGRHVTLVPLSDAMAKMIGRIEVTESAPGRPRRLVVEEASGARMDIRFTPLDDDAGSP